jgi:hypothetical protein
MNGFAKASPTMVTGSWAAGPWAIGADASGRRVAAEIPASTEAADVPRTASVYEARPRDLLHPALLLFERDVIHARYLHSAPSKALCPRLWEVPAHRAVRHSETGSIRRHREHSMHQPSLLNLTLIETCELSAAAKFASVHSSNAALDSRISINIDDVDVIDNRSVIPVKAVPEAAVEASAPPGMADLKGSQRHPSNSAKPETYADASSPAPSKEPHVGWRPVVA